MTAVVLALENATPGGVVLLWVTPAAGSCRRLPRQEKMQPLSSLRRRGVRVIAGEEQIEAGGAIIKWR